MNGVIPVADIVGPPLAGFVADRIGNFRYIVLKNWKRIIFKSHVFHFRVFMSVLTGVSGLASLLLMLIPPKSDSRISDQGYIKRPN